MMMMMTMIIIIIIIIIIITIITIYALETKTGDKLLIGGLKILRMP